MTNFRLLMILPFALLLTACATHSDKPAGTISGQIYPDQPMTDAAGKNYTVKVKLADVSKMDVAATTITETSFALSSFPADYQLNVDPESLSGRMSYAVQVRISDADGNLVAITDRVHSYTPDKPSGDYDILVKPLSLPTTTPLAAMLSCGADQYYIRLYPELATVNQAFNGQAILPRVASASGEKFEKNGHLLFVKGEEGPIVEKDGERINCTMTN